MKTMSKKCMALLVAMMLVASSIMTVPASAANYDYGFRWLSSTSFMERKGLFASGFNVAGETFTVPSGCIYFNASVTVDNLGSANSVTYTLQKEGWFGIWSNVASYTAPANSKIHSAFSRISVKSGEKYRIFYSLDGTMGDAWTSGTFA